MGEKQIPILFLVLFMWLLAGAGFCSYKIGQAAPETVSSEAYGSVASELDGSASITEDDTKLDEIRIEGIRQRAQNRALIFQFEVNGNEVSMSDSQNELLDDLAYFVKNVEGSHLEVSGHTDSYGKYQYNMDLSEKRARLVGNLLKDRGVSTTKITSIGYGKDRPLAPNDTKENRNKNRRVEIVLR